MLALALAMPILLGHMFRYGVFHFSIGRASGHDHTGLLTSLPCFFFGGGGGWEGSMLYCGCL